MLQDLHLISEPNQTKFPANRVLPENHMVLRIAPEGRESAQRL